MVDPATDYPADPDSPPLARDMAGSWGWVLAYGVLLVILAVLLLGNPYLTGLATGWLLGILLVVYGILAIVAGLRWMAGGARWIEVLLGILAVAVGLYALWNPLIGALSLLWAIGIWLLVAGGFQIAHAFRTRENRLWWLVLGVLDVILGLVLAFSGPIAGLAMLAFLVSLSFAMRGVFMITAALALRRLAAG